MDLTESYFYDSIKTVQTITAEEVRTLAKEYLNPDDFYELMVV
jgi:zinc protease